MPARSPLGPVERLEDRTLPSAFGVAWPDAQHLTLSFTPDGTPTAVGPTDLASLLNKAGTTTAWETAVLRAFQTWAVNANINIGLVADGGQALGTPGAVEGDPRFGDVRVGAATTHSPEVASAGPFTWIGSTLSGDVLFDDSRPFSVGNVAGAYDVFSVALHEAGHALGLDHSTEAGSAMNEAYSFRTGLSAGDVANIQQLYGTRTPDAFDAAHTNNTLSTASVLKSQSDLVGVRYTADGDLTTAADVDCYKFTAPLGYNGVTIHLQAQGLSLVVPRVTVYDSSGKVVASGVGVNPLNNDVTLRFSAPLLGGTYTVKVEAGTAGGFGVGSYRLTADAALLGATLPILPALLAPVVDGLTNDTLATATALTSGGQPQADSRFDAAYRGSIESAKDTDYYKIAAPLSSPGGPTNLNVVVWGLDASPLDPRVHLYDASGKPVPFEVLANQTGLMSVVVPGINPGQTYYIQVAARNPGGANGTGGYLLGADFNQSPPVTPDTVAGNSLASSAVQTGSLAVDGGGMYQFFLNAETGGAVNLSVLDAGGNVVLSLDATSGQPLVTGVTYLAVGTYTVRYTNRSSTASTRYDLLLLQLSEGVGPYPSSTSTSGSDPSSTSTSPSPSSPPPSSSSGYTYSGSSSTQSQPNSYYFF